MKIQLRSRDKSALTVLAVAAFLWLLIGWVAFPFYDTLKASPALASEKEDLLRKYRGVLARRGSQTQTLNTVTQDLNRLDSTVIRAENVSLASVELQSIVEQAASQSNIAIAQRNVSPVRAKDAFFGEMSATLNFECTPGQLVSFLSALRNSSKILNVRALQVSPAQMVSEPPQRGEWTKTVRVNLILVALVTAGAAQPAANQGGQTK